jgi:FAD/FMN-containing dehydrogenase
MRPEPTRRSVVTGLAAGALVVGFDPLTRSWAGDGPLRNVPPLDGRLTVDPAARSAAADDFGHLVHRHPLAVLEPGSVQDVAVMLRFCRKHRILVAARGQGHATFGQAQVSAGLIIDMGTLRDIRVRDNHVGDNSVAVQAGARWSEVLRATVPYGLAPPVLTDYLELSVGGTLSAGGLGGSTHQHGAQVDNVLELEVVTGAGERTVCSPTRRPDLFHAVLAGLGQCAIITQATIRLLPAPATVRHYQLFYPSVAALTADQRRVVRDGRFPFVQGQALPPAEGAREWRYLLEAVAFPRRSTPPDDDALLGDLNFERGTQVIDDLPYLDFLDRLAPTVELLKSIGEWARPHPWWNVLLPDSVVDEFVTSVMADLTPADIGASGVILVYPLRRAKLHLPLLRAPNEPLVFLFALLKTASPGALPAADMLDANLDLYRRARSLGGFQYPVGSIPLTGKDWRVHFGSAWPAFAAAKRRYDPAVILAPGQGVFR